MKSSFRFILILAITVCFFSNCKEKEVENPPIKVSASFTLPSCDTCKDATIDLTISGGTRSYTVNWDDGSVGEHRQKLGEGTYIYTVIDQKNQLFNDSIEIYLSHELVEIQTDYGNMLLWLYYQTPLHRANFLKLTKEGFYNGLIFHRVINDFVIQGGDPDGTGSGGPGYKIDAEFVSSITHVFGAVGAARDSNPLKQSNGSQFYICENTAGSHHLDNNYTVFGLLIDGEAALHAIAEVQTGTGDRPLTDVVMNQLLIKEFNSKELLMYFAFAVPK
ncbi:peptidylprolyl isomerase [Bacteroidota bacterium]